MMNRGIAISGAQINSVDFVYIYSIDKSGMDYPQTSKGQIRFLQTLKLKKYRQRYGCFIVEGRKVVEEILQDNLLKINSLYGLQGWLEVNGRLVEEKNIPYFILSPQHLKQVSSFSTPDLVLAECAIPDFQPPIDSGNWLLYLDSLADPGNLGTILRSADWFGVQDVILSPGSVDSYNPKCVQASMGSIGRIRIHYLEFGVLRSLFPAMPVFLAHTEGIPCQNLNIPRPGILVIGSESHGISEGIKAFDHTRITIQKHPQSRVESLNAAMAATALLTLLSDYSNFSSV